MINCCQFCLNFGFEFNLRRYASAARGALQLVQGPPGCGKTRFVVGPDMLCSYCTNLGTQHPLHGGQVRA